MTMRLLLVLFSLVISSFLDAQLVVINEFVASNDQGVADEDGDFEDWVELYNAGTALVNLEGYALSDDADNLNQWVFPQYTLQPGAFLLVFCSGKNRIDAPFFHTNFKIAKHGEPLILTTPDGVTSDAVQPTPVASGFSFARVVDGTGYFERTDVPTPGSANHTGDWVVFSHEPGAYANGFELVMNNPSGYTVRYTTDGSLPTATSPVADEPIAVSNASLPEPVIAHLPTSTYWVPPQDEVPRIHTFRACAFDGNVPVTRVFSMTYIVGNGVDVDTYPVVSIQTAPENLFDYDTGIFVTGAHFNPSNAVWTGNFFQRGIEWERDVHISYFENGDLKWAQDAGMRIHGGKTRNAPQKSLRLYGRAHLGANKFNFPFFETKEKRVFDKFILRAHFGCWNKTMIKDGLSGYVARDLDFDTQHVRLVMVFINGEYWGLQAVRDRFDANYFEETYGVPKEEVNLLLHGSGTNPNNDESWGIVAGDNGHYLDMLQFIDDYGLVDPLHYQYVTNLLDVNSMIDFYCTAIYLNQYDWPSNNHKVWRGSGPSKWRSMMYDFDSAWGYRPVSHNTLVYASHPTGSSIYNTPYTTFLFRHLLEQEAFRQQLISRMGCLMNTVFEPSTLEQAIDAFVALYEPGAAQQIARWSNSFGYQSWLTSIDARLYDFNAERREHVIEHFSSYFSIDFNPDDYPCLNDEEEGEEEEEEEPMMVTGHQAPGLLVYPNPSRDWVSIDFNGSASTMRYAVYDLSGRMVERGALRQRERIAVHDWPSGMYLLVLEDEHTRLTKRFAVE